MYNNEGNKYAHRFFEYKKTTQSKPSKIPAWAIKDAKAALAEPPCYLNIQFITEGKIPEGLTKASVTPLFKKGNPEDPLNYMPISVTSALSKIFEVHKSEVS